MKFLNNLFGRTKIKANQNGVFDNQNKRTSFVNSLLAKRQNDLAAYVTLKYYDTCSAIFTAVNMISTECTNIEPLIYDKINKKFITDHPIIDLLNNPSLAFDYEEFIQYLVVYYLVTGNVYIILNGKDINNPPMSITIANPMSVTVRKNSFDGYVDFYEYTAGSTNLKFSRQLINNQFRYISNNNSEIKQIRTVNPDNQLITGKSPLSPLYYEIEQYLSSSVHNLSNIKRGSKLSGMYQTPRQLSDEAFTRLRQEINAHYSGEQNSGKALIMEGDVKFIPTDGVKDMDYNEMRKDVSGRIYRVYNIPAPLVSEDTMTMANMDAAKFILYDSAVLPVLNRIFSGLTSFLMTRYAKTDNQKLIITYDESSISALKGRTIQDILNYKNTGIYTTNELRKQTGDKPLEGGDDLYQPSANVPYARDVEGADSNA